MMNQIKHLLSATIMGGVLLFAASAGHASDPAVNAVALGKIIADRSEAAQSLSPLDITEKMDAQRQLMDRLLDRTKADVVLLMQNAHQAGVENLDLYQSGIDILISDHSEAEQLATLKSLERATQVNNWQQQYLANLLLGLHFIHERDSLRAMSYAQNALESIPIRDDSLTADDARYETYDLLHTAFTVDRNTNKMIAATEKLLEYGEKTGRTIDYIPLIHNLGYLFSKSYDFETATKLSGILISLQEGQPDYQRAIANYSHGTNLSEAGKYTEAVPYLENAASLSADSRFGVAANIRLSLAYSKTGQTSKSRNLIYKLEKSQVERDSFERMLPIINRSKAENARRIGDYKAAYKYMDAWSDARSEELEGLLSEDRRRASEGLALTERVSREKEARLKSEAAASKEIAQRGKMIAIFAGMLVIALGFITINLNRQRERQVKINAELAAAKDRAEAGERAKSSFLSMMGHELRTPMNPIISLADILYARVPDLETKRMLKMISSSGRAMLSMVENILIVSDETRRKLAISTQPTKVREFIRFNSTGFQRDAEDKGVQFNVSIDPNVPEYLPIDKLKVRSILANILSNAVKFTEKGSVQMSVLIVDDSHVGVSLLISIKDSGTGMTQTEIDQLRAVFNQRDASHTKAYDGVGVGLYVSELYTKAHGGRLRMVSHPQDGTRVDIYLPLDKVAPKQLAA